MTYLSRSLAVWVLLLMAGHAFSADDWQSIQSDSGSLLLQGTQANRVLTIRGKWLMGGNYNLPRVPAVNAAWIFCEEATKSCRESHADVAKLRNPASDVPPMLSVSEYRYEILEWSKDVIVAKRVTDTGKIDAKLTINHKTGAISLNHKERADNNGFFQPSDQTYTMKISMLFGS